MMLNKFIRLPYCLLVLVFTLTGCEKEDSLRTVVQEANLNCDNGITSNSYVEGILEGQEFCFNIGERGEGGYWAWTAMTSRFITNSPQLTVGSGNTQGAVSSWLSIALRHDEMGFHPMFEISTPVIIDNTKSKYDLFNEYFNQIGDLPIRNPTTPSTEGYNVQVKITHDAKKNGYGGSRWTPYNLETGEGGQPDSYLRIVSLEKVEQPQGMDVTIEFEFDVQLYQDGKQSKHYGRLENGRMYASFFVEK
ncbi:MAG: hypothetical protein AAGG75_27250 [Bacteroidota bacterium]